MYSVYNINLFKFTVSFHFVLGNSDIFIQLLLKNVILYPFRFVFYFNPFIWFLYLITSKQHFYSFNFLKQQKKKKKC